MDGIQNIYREGTDFVSRYYLPKNTKEIISIGLYFLVTFYLTDYFLNYRLFKWIYLGTIVILVASWYRGSTPRSGHPFVLGHLQTLPSS